MSRETRGEIVDKRERGRVGISNEVWRMEC